MEKIIFLAPYPAASAPSQRFRFEQYIPKLKTEFDIEFHPFLNEKGWQSLYLKGRFGLKAWRMMQSFGRRYLLLFKIRKAKHVFIHREASQIGPPIFEWFIAKILRKKYVFDFDDAIWMPNYSETNATFQRLKAYWKIKFVIRWAHKVTAGNDYLAEYARRYNSNVQVIPTTIDTDYHHPLVKSNQKKTRIGWTGSHTTMQYLPLLIEPLSNLAQKYDFEFVVISNENPELPIPNFKFIKWSKEREMVDLGSFDIGVMPLAEDQWSAGKCGFKALQYLALEIPTILTPVGVNKNIVEHGKEGFYALDDKDWGKYLELLIKDKTQRAIMGKKGREKVIRQYSVNSQTNTYKELFTS